MRRRLADRVAEDVARGSCQGVSDDDANNISMQEKHTALDNLEDNMIAARHETEGISKDR